MSDDVDLQSQLQSLDIGTRLLYSEVVIGKDAEEFMVSELGKTMIGLAQQDYADALISLGETSWFNLGKSRELQNRASVAKMFVGYLRDLIVRGRQAQIALREGEEDNG